MSRKVVFWGYFLIALVMVALVPRSFPDISAPTYASLLFGYQEKPFYLMMVSTFSLFFDYVSVTIPQAELFSIREFFLLRQPNPKRLYLTYFRFVLPYLVPFIITKAYAVIIWNNPVIWLWISISILEWLLWLLINLSRHVMIPNGFILVLFVITRVVAHYLIN